MLWGKKHYMKSLLDFQMLTEECPPGSAKVQKTQVMGTRSRADVLHTADNGGATELWPEAPSPGAATEELRAGLASPALLQLLPCTSDGTRSPSYTPFLLAN